MIEHFDNMNLSTALFFNKHETEETIIWVLVHAWLMVLVFGGVHISQSLLVFCFYYLSFMQVFGGVHIAQSLLVFSFYYLSFMISNNDFRYKYVIMISKISLSNHLWMAQDHSVSILVHYQHSHMSLVQIALSLIDKVKNHI